MQAKPGFVAFVQTKTNFEAGKIRVVVCKSSKFHFRKDTVLSRSKRVVWNKNVKRKNRKFLCARRLVAFSRPNPCLTPHSFFCLAQNACANERQPSGMHSMHSMHSMPECSSVLGDSIFISQTACKGRAPRCSPHTRKFTVNTWFVELVFSLEVHRSVTSDEKSCCK